MPVGQRPIFRSRCRYVSHSVIFTLLFFVVWMMRDLVTTAPNRMKRILVCVILAVIIIFCIGIVLRRRGTDTRATPLPTGFSKPLLYLLQTESCIPDRLKSVKIMGDPRACRCDVLILSYKKECTVTPPVHMMYIIFANLSTTWA